MKSEFSAFVCAHLLGETTTHPLARLAARLPLSRLLAGPGLRRRCFAAATRPDAPSGASNCGFQDTFARTRWIAAGSLLLTPSWAFAAPDTAGSLFTVLLSLGLILGGFVAVAWFVRRYLPGMGAQGVVKVVGTTAVGPRERVVVVEVDHTWLMLGVGGGSVRLLHTLPKPADSKTLQVERP